MIKLAEICRVAGPFWHDCDHQLQTSEGSFPVTSISILYLIFDLSLV